MRAVAGDHGHEIAADLFFAVELDDLLLHQQIGNPLALSETVGIVAQCADVRLEMHAGLLRRAHHALWLHLDRLQVNGGDFHAVALLGNADGGTRRRRPAPAAGAGQLRG